MKHLRKLGNALALGIAYGIWWIVIAIATMDFDHNRAVMFSMVSGSVLAFIAVWVWKHMTVADEAREVIKREQLMLEYLDEHAADAGILYDERYRVNRRNLMRESLRKGSK